MKKKLKKEDPRVAELIDTVKRVQADFENYKKRMDKDVQMRARYACSDIIMKILPVLDNLDLALKNSDNQEELVKGMDLIHAQFMEILDKEGVKRIECVGKDFDPRLHEAMMTEKSDKDNVVLEEFQPGYTIQERVLRHAKVKVGNDDKKDHSKGDSGKTREKV